ncbi:MAG: polysaccharide deacetylase family protein [Spirochaetes bacterium]|nr:polysaccharide deacetylase family protein [Spirochaetota bacterium]
MHKVFLTMDFEDWTDVPYFKGHLDSDKRLARHALPFMQEMADMGIFFTVFALGRYAKDDPETIRSLAKMGHEIACHGLDHTLLYNLSPEDFVQASREAKIRLEELSGKPVIGYRAPCFSMQNDKLSALWELGFKYDASMIRFKEHRYYNVMDLSRFKKRDGLIHEIDGHIEFETPTVNIFGKYIPFTGGGYFRLFPLFILKFLAKRYLKKEGNYMLYIHPWELAKDSPETASKIKLINQFVFKVGRKRLVGKLKKFILWLQKQNVQFIRMGDFCNISSK